MERGVLILEVKLNVSGKTLNWDFFAKIKYPREVQNPPTMSFWSWLKGALGFDGEHLTVTQGNLTVGAGQGGWKLGLSF